jgi:hypothetical protein
MAMIRNITPQLSERGKIKIGVKGRTVTSSRGNEFQPPQKLDHFVVTTLDRDETGNFVRDPEAHALYGEKPTSLPVRLLFDDPEGNFSSRYACFIGQKLWCAGDGVTATRQNGAGPVKVECPCERIQIDYTGKDRCKFNGALSVILDGMAGVGGVWKFRTTSYNSVTNIMSALAQIKLITGGPLAGIHLNLVLRPKIVASPTDGKMQTVYIVSLEYPGSMEELQELGMNRLRRQIEHRIEVRQLETQARKLLLPSPSAVFDGETEDEIADEFYPPQDTTHAATATIDPETGEVASVAAQQLASAADAAGGDAPANPPSQSAPTGQLKQQLIDSIALETAKNGQDFVAASRYADDPAYAQFLKDTPQGKCWKRTAIENAMRAFVQDLDAQYDADELKGFLADNSASLDACAVALPRWYYGKEGSDIPGIEKRISDKKMDLNKMASDDPGRYLGA